MSRLDEYAEAKKAVQIAFASRFPGAGQVVPKIRYAGQFPYSAVAAKGHVCDGSDIKDHRESWANLYAEFDAAWRAYIEK